MKKDSFEKAAAAWPSIQCSQKLERMKKEQSSSVLAMEKVVVFKRTFTAEQWEWKPDSGGGEG